MKRFFAYLHGSFVKDGVVILARDDDKRCDFQETALTNYFDFYHTEKHI